ncbi:MAG: hypothetical protein LIO54_09325 [Oscillospiraceae bacterium]|nr:hypothetical protein [Oscillospiraceae bacterium]
MICNGVFWQKRPGGAAHRPARFYCLYFTIPAALSLRSIITNGEKLIVHFLQQKSLAFSGKFKNIQISFCKLHKPGTCVMILERKYEWCREYPADFVGGVQKL